MIQHLSARSDLAATMSAVARQILDLVQAQPADVAPVVGLCGGRSVGALLGALSTELQQRPREVVGRVQFFMVDERLVPLADPHSNYGALAREIFDPLVAAGVLRPDQLHPFVADPTASDHGCGGYTREFNQYGGRFTVVVVGVGEDGHVAGLFPRHPVLRRTEPVFFSFYDSPKPPAGRMTAGLTLVRSAQLGIVLALGEGKREAWQRMLQAETELDECPAVLARELPEALVVTDLV